MCVCVCMCVAVCVCVCDNWSVFVLISIKASENCLLDFVVNMKKTFQIYNIVLKMCFLE